MRILGFFNYSSHNVMPNVTCTNRQFVSLRKDFFSVDGASSDPLNRKRILRFSFNPRNSFKSFFFNFFSSSFQMVKILIPRLCTIITISMIVWHLLSCVRHGCPRQLSRPTTSIQHFLLRNQSYV